ncbi:MAG TPA: hypothetical protein VNJ03_01690 [Vicinamibacterales bacterium]|nr:hypothetical protein [Vicinamibacterales bacterium]
MVRILRAFAWLRWRMLVNALERTGSRDTLERFSIAIEKLGPILAGVLLIPSALVLAGLGAAAGYALALGAPRPMLFEVSRYLLLTLPLLAVIGPFFLPAADRTNPVRLLLLPIPRSTLYVAQSSASFGDPWNLLALPLLICLAAGLLAGGQPLAALVSLAAAVCFVVVLLGLASVATSVLHLLVRDRRRGELIALLFIVILPFISLLPAMFDQSARRDGASRESRDTATPTWVDTATRRALATVPSEIYASATRDGAAGAYGRAGLRVGALAAMATLLHAIGALAFGRVLDSPGSSGARRAAPMQAAWGWRIPGLSRGASAVALAQLRLALRTPRGRSTLLSPLIMFVVFGSMMYRGSGSMELGFFRFDSGFSLASFASVICLLSLLPIAMNQFAVDRAGLTRAFLSPLTDAELLAGKAVGNALIVMAPCLFCVIASFAVFRGGMLALWMTIPLGLIAMYLVVAPVAAIGSAIFPRSVDLNSIGRGSNAHGAAGLIGLLSFVAAGAPPVLLTLLAVEVLKRPVLAPVLVGGWCVVAYLIGRLLFIPARRVFHARRENLAQLR